MRRANVRPCRRRDAHVRRRVPSALAFVAALAACIALREGWRLGELRGAATLLEAEAEIAAARAAASHASLVAHGVEAEDLESRIARARELVARRTEAIAAAEATCDYELEALKSQWDGETQLAVLDVSEAEEDVLAEVGRRIREDRRRVREGTLEPLAQERAAAAARIAALGSQRVRVERGRVLGHALNRTDDAYLDAFVDRLTRGTFRSDYTYTSHTLSNHASASGNSSPHARLGPEAYPKVHAAGLDDGRHVWHIDARGDAQPLAAVAELPPGFLEALPEEDALGRHQPRGGVWQTCAVVGNSGLLLHYEVRVACMASYRRSPPFLPSLPVPPSLPSLPSSSSSASLLSFPPTGPPAIAWARTSSSPIRPI